MIGFYWPRKSVPSYLEEFEFSGTSDGIPSVMHAGFGFIFKYRGFFYVWGLSGDFIRVDGAHMSLKVKGGGRGVVYSTNIRWLIQQVRSRDYEYQDKGA